MPRLAGHNQSSFIEGARSTGPDLEGFFKSASRLSNYDVLPSGHLKRRKGVDFLSEHIPLNNRVIKTFLKFKNFYFFLLDDGCIYVNANLQKITCTPYQINRYRTSDVVLDPYTSFLEIPDLPLAADDNITQLIESGDKLWAVSSSHFAPFIIEEINDFLEVKPLYLYRSPTDSSYHFLRTIPLDPLDGAFDNIVIGDLDFKPYVRLFIDKASDLSTNRCRAWFGLDLPDGIDNPEFVNANLVGLNSKLNTPLFFNVLPTKGAIIDKTSDYDNSSDFTGTAIAGLNSLVDLAGFEAPGEEKRILLQEFLFSRKYCIIPIETIKGDLADKASYSDVFTDIPAINAKTTVSMSFESLAPSKTLSYEFPDNKRIEVQPEEFVNVSADNPEEALIADYQQNDTVVANFRMEITPARDFSFRVRTGSDDLDINFRMDFTLGDGLNFFDGATNINSAIESATFDIRAEADHRNALEDYSEREQRRIENDLEDRAEELIRNGNIAGLPGLITEFLQEYGLSSERDTGELRIDAPRITFKRTVFEEGRLPTGASVSFQPSVGGEPIVISARDDAVSENRRVISFEDVDRDGYAYGLTMGASVLGTWNFTFQRSGETIPLTIQGDPTGTRYFGYAKQQGRGRLDVAYDDVFGNEQRDFVDLFKSSSNWSKLSVVGFGYDFTKRKNKFVLGYTTNVDMSSLRNFSFSGRRTRVDNYTESYKEGLFVKEWDVTDDIPYQRALERRPRFFLLPGFPAEFNKTNNQYEYVWGWSRFKAAFDTGEGEPVVIPRPNGSVSPLLQDHQGLIAVGFQLIVDETLKFTPFVLMNKRAVLASSDICTLNLGDQDYTLSKFDIETSEAVQAFRLPEPLTEALPDLKRTTDVRLTFGQTSYEFVQSQVMEEASNAYANCLIFEIGIPSPIKVNDRRHIGGNNFTDKHAIVSRFVEGDLSGFEAAAVAGSEDIWTANTGVLQKFSRDPALHSNNFINRLTNLSALEVRETQSNFGVNLAVLAGQTETVEGTELTVLLKFLEAKAINLRESYNYDNMVNYISAYHLEASERLYTLELIDINGKSLNPLFLQADRHGQANFIGTDDGVFFVHPTATRPELISRYVPKSPPVFLNDELVFVSASNHLIKLVSSRERLGYREELLGLKQERYLSSVLDLVYNPRLDEYFMQLDNTVSPICRAINVMPSLTDSRISLAGYSTYSFFDVDAEVLNPEPYLNVRKLSVIDGDLHAIVDYNEETRMISFTNEKAWDNEQHEFESLMFSNSLIFNNLSGYDGATALIGIKQIALFENGINQALVGSALENTEDESLVLQATLQEYIQRDDQGNKLFLDAVPYYDLQNSLLYGQKLVISQQNKDNLGIIYGFQATTNVDPGV